MYDAILVITALVILFLGFRLAMKFREMARWKDEDTVVGGKGNAALPRELRELKIDEPSEDSVDRIDATDKDSTSGNAMSPKRT